MLTKPRPCGCKGIRTCLLCEAEFGVEKVFNEQDLPTTKTFEYCYLCNKAWEGVDVVKEHGNHSGECMEYPGVLIIPNFITEEEEEQFVTGCDSLPWDLSVSGRRKQNFGPKTNFKKKKINGKSFNGFPKFSEYFQDKLRTVDLLKDFQTIEQCSIEYRVETGACIDPHIDDCWVWGERVISINLLSDSYLTMTKYLGPSSRYNLEFYEKQNHITASTSPDISNKQKHQDELQMNSDSSTTVKTSNANTNCSSDYPIVRLPMPVRSLLVLYGPARYEWEHCIHRSDIKSRRICMAYREFTTMYLKGGSHYEDHGAEILQRAQNFF